MTREGVGNGIKEGLQTGQAGCGTAHNRRNIPLQNALMDRLGDLFLGDFLLHQNLFHDFLADHGNGVIKRFLVSCSNLLKLSCHRNLTTHTLCVELKCLHFDQVDHCIVARNGDRAHRCTEGFMQLCEYTVKIRVIVIAFIDKKRLRNADFLGKSPRQFGTDLNAGFGIHDNGCGIRHTHCLLNLSDKIQKAGCVKEIDLNIVPHHGRHRRCQRKASCFFFRIIVTRGISIRGFSHTVNLFGQEKYGFCKRGFAAAAMSQQCHIPDLFRLNYSHNRSAHRRRAAMISFPK